MNAYNESIAALPIISSASGRFAYLVDAQKFARTNNQDRYWRLCFFNEYATHESPNSANKREVFFMSKSDYLECLTKLADRGWRVDGSILYTDSVSDSPNAR